MKLPATVLITGATGGIGAALARYYAAPGRLYSALLLRRLRASAHLEICGIVPQRTRPKA